MKNNKLDIPEDVKAKMDNYRYRYGMRMQDHILSALEHGYSLSEDAKILDELRAENERLKEKNKNQEHTITEFQEGLSKYLLNEKIGICFFSDAKKYLHETQPKI